MADILVAARAVSCQPTIFRGLLALLLVLMIVFSSVVALLIREIKFSLLKEQMISCVWICCLYALRYFYLFSLLMIWFWTRAISSASKVSPVHHLKQWKLFLILLISTNYRIYFCNHPALKSFGLIETEKLLINFAISNHDLIASPNFPLEGDELEGNSSFHWFSIKGKFVNNFHVFWHS